MINDNAHETQRQNSNESLSGSGQYPLTPDAILITFPGDVLVATVSGHRTPDDTLYYAEFITELYGILGGKKA